MGKKKNKNKINGADLIPVFRIKPVNHSNMGKLIHCGNITRNSKLGDEDIDIIQDELSKKSGMQNAHYITKHGKYDIYAKFFKCNILGSYLFNNEDMPVFYMSLIFEKQFLAGFLGNFSLIFLPDKGEIKSVSKISDSLNVNLNGTYFIEFYYDKEEDTKNKFLEFKEKEINMKSLEKLISCSDGSEITDEQLLQVKMENEIEVKKYSDFFERRQIDKYTSMKIIIEKILKPLSRSDILKEFINFALNYADEKREKNILYDAKQTEKALELGTRFEGDYEYVIE